ncbi:MAG: metal ABC transporter permease [bacterium]|nr:metal ABC transporter permease [bacterium]
MSLHQMFIEPLTYAWMIKGLLIACLVSLALGLLGCFLVLRRLSLMGDALAHTVLPGIVIAFLISNSRASLPLLIGASVVGFITTLLINGIHLKSRVKEDAAMGIVYSTLFAIGVVLLTAFASHVDLDPDCVLYGDLLGVPETSIWVMLTVAGMIIVGIILFYKQLLITAFDAQLSNALGISSAWTHYIFMGFLSLVLVTSFEAVGSVLVVAMLIAPGATALFWSDRLPRMLVIAGALSIVSAVSGLYISVWLNCSPAGAIVCTAFIFFVVSLLVSPRYGLIARALRAARLRRKILLENILKEAVKVADYSESPIPLATLQATLKMPAGALLRGSKRLQQRKEATLTSSTLTLTPAGIAEGERILRNHRLWELFLSREFELPEDHLHRDADDIEHIMTPELAAALAVHLDDPRLDPHGKPIPPSRSN